MKPEISIIISIYNKIDLLLLVLKSLELQTYKNFEVILSDDGSNNDSISKIKEFEMAYKFNIKHIWHPDNGWNKNAILNKSIMAADSGYIIFVDGDCLLHHKFIEEHYINKEPNKILAGRRVNLSKRVSEKLSLKLIGEGYLNNNILKGSIWDSLKADAKDVEQGIFIKSPLIRRYLNRKDKGILGSNFSVAKQDLLVVNGFDERFFYPAAGEDTDIEARLRRSGLTVKTIRNQAIQYHLYHKALPRAEERLVYLDENNANEVIFTPFGIVKDR